MPTACPSELKLRVRRSLLRSREPANTHREWRPVQLQTPSDNRWLDQFVRNQLKEMLSTDLTIRVMVQSCLVYGGVSCSKGKDTRPWNPMSKSHITRFFPLIRKLRTRTNVHWFPMRPCEQRLICIGNIGDPRYRLSVTQVRHGEWHSDKEERTNRLCCP